MSTLGYPVPSSPAYWLWTVRPLKPIVSWVQILEREVGFYPPSWASARQRISYSCHVRKDLRLIAS